MIWMWRKSQETKTTVSTRFRHGFDTVSVSISGLQIGFDRVCDTVSGSMTVLQIGFDRVRDKVSSVANDAIKEIVNYYLVVLSYYYRYSALPLGHQTPYTKHC